MEDILEFLQEDLGSKPGQGASVQFQTPVRANPDNVGSEMNLIGMEVPRNNNTGFPSMNLDLNLSSSNLVAPSCLDDEAKLLQKMLNKIRNKVYRSGGTGYTFEGKPVQSQLNVEALLEKELLSKYVPVSSFVCPYILLDFIYQYLIDKFTLSVSDRTKCDDCGLELFNFWAGEAKQKIVLSLLSTTTTTKTIQGVNYKYSPSLKYKLPFLLS